MLKGAWLKFSFLFYDYLFHLCIHQPPFTLRNKHENDTCHHPLIFDKLSVIDILAHEAQPSVGPNNYRKSKPMYL